MSRIYIVRHGNTFDPGDVIRRVGGRTDLPLSSSGLKQAELLAKHFEKKKFDEAFSSDLKRTRQTAQTILGDQSFQLTDFLKEIDYGPDEGQPEDQVISRIGVMALKLWDEEAIPPKDWHVEPSNLRAAWAQFLTEMPRHTDTLVVTSNGVARFLLDVVEGGQDAPKKLRTGAYGVIHLSETGPVLEAWNVRP